MPNNGLAGKILAALYLDEELALGVVVLGIGTWIVTVIHAALWLKVPWAYGPVQFWVDAPGESFMEVRALALLLVLAGLPLAVATVTATIISLFLSSPVPRWRRCIVPVVALTMFAYGYYVFGHYSFFPSA